MDFFVCTLAKRVASLHLSPDLLALTTHWPLHVGAMALACSSTCYQFMWNDKCSSKAKGAQMLNMWKQFLFKSVFWSNWSSPWFGLYSRLHSTIEYKTRISFRTIGSLPVQKHAMFFRINNVSANFQLCPLHIQHAWQL